VSNPITEICTRGALASTVNPVELAASHVHFDQLSGRATLEKVLFDALRGPAKACWELCGPDGAGKSSTFSRLIHDLTRLEESPYEVLMLNVGDPKVLTSTHEFAQHVIATIANQAHRFASPVQEEIAQAGADQITRTPARRSHRSQIEADAHLLRIGYTLDLSERFDELSWGAQPARAAGDLQAIIQALKGAGRRPVVVIDDTEKFALTKDGTVDEKALTNLAAVAIPTLADLDVDLLVATHPQFSTNKALGRARQKWLKHNEIPTLAMAKAQTLPLGTIIDRHLLAHDMKLRWSEVFEETVVHQLQSLYLACERNLRHVLNLAQDAVVQAEQASAQLVCAEHLYSAQIRS
jgi:hypothetical protein